MKSFKINDDTLNNVRFLEEKYKQILEDSYINESLFLFEGDGILHESEDYLNKIVSFTQNFVSGNEKYKYIDIPKSKNGYIFFKVIIPFEEFKDCQECFMEKPIVELNIKLAPMSYFTNTDSYGARSSFSILKNITKIKDGKLISPKFLFNLTITNKNEFNEQFLKSRINHEFLHAKRYVSEYNVYINKDNTTYQNKINSRKEFGQQLTSAINGDGDWFKQNIILGLYLMNHDEKIARGGQIPFELDEINKNPHLKTYKEKLYHCPVVQYTLKQYKTIIDNLNSVRDNHDFENRIKKEFNFKTINHFIFKLVNSRNKQIDIFIDRLEKWAIKQEENNFKI